MLKIAITGNIASGKSEVEKILINKGYKVFDADKIAHICLNNSDEIKDTFKNYDVFEDNEISRKKLGDLVFHNNDLLNKLNNIIHPMVNDKILELFNDYKNEDYIFISVPLLYETGMDKLFDKVLFVYADDNLRLERIMKRNNLSKEEALRRMNSQKSQKEKIKKSNIVIINNTDISDLQDQLNKLF